MALKAEYLLTEGSGTTANDTSGNGKTGTLLVGPHIPTWNPGAEGGLVFDGDPSSSVIVPDSTLANDDTSVTDVTFETWVKITSVENPGRIIWFEGNELTSIGSTGNYQGTLVFIGNLTNGTSVAIPNAIWHQIVFVRTGTVLNIYLDGVLDGTVDTGNSDPLTLSFSNGKFLGGDDNSRASIIGMIGLVRIYNSALSGIDVANNFTSDSPRFLASPPTIDVQCPANRGTKNIAYSSNSSASGGTGPYTFAVTSGTLPTGLTLDSDGTLHGTPTVNNTFTFEITATDSLANTGVGSCTIIINNQLVPIGGRIFLAKTSLFLSDNVEPTVLAWPITLAFGTQSTQYDRIANPPGWETPPSADLSAIDPSLMSIGNYLNKGVPFVVQMPNNGSSGFPLELFVIDPISSLPTAVDATKKPMITSVILPGGPWKFGSSYYLISLLGVNGISTPLRLAIYKSADGIAYTEQDSSNEPQVFNLLSSWWDGLSRYIRFVISDISNNIWLQEFDTQTDTWTSKHDMHPTLTFATVFNVYIRAASNGSIWVFYETQGTPRNVYATKFSGTWGASILISDNNPGIPSANGMGLSDVLIDGNNACHVFFGNEPDGTHGPYPLSAWTQYYRRLDDDGTLHTVFLFPDYWHFFAGGAQRGLQKGCGVVKSDSLIYAAQLQTTPDPPSGLIQPALFTGTPLSAPSWSFIQGVFTRETANDELNELFLLDAQDFGSTIELKIAFNNAAPIPPTPPAPTKCIP